MKFVLLKTLTVVGILTANFYGCKGAPAKPQDRSLADNYTALAEDVKWFFRGISKMADTVDQLLPNATMDLTKTRTLSANTRVTLLIGLRHLVVGVREIAITFEKNFSTDHVKQLCQLKSFAKFINDVISTLKMWFGQIRAIAMHSLLLYNRYFPEVLLGKCLTNYLAITYPERAFYEYPLILLSEMYASIAIYHKTSEPTNTTELIVVDAALNMEQNEIFNSDSDDSKTVSARQLNDNSTELSYGSENFFDFSSVLSPNKDKIIEIAANEQSWQICLKLYTAESISRSLKLYFLGL